MQLKFKAALQIFYGLENSLLLSSKSQPSSPASSRRSSSSLPGLFYSSTNTTIPTLSIFYEARILGSLLLNDEIVTGCGLINLSKPLMVVYLERLLSPLQSGFEVDESSDSAELFQSVLTQVKQRNPFNDNSKILTYLPYTLPPVLLESFV